MDPINDAHTRNIENKSGKVIKVHTASRSFDPFNKLIPDARATFDDDESTRVKNNIAV